MDFSGLEETIDSVVSDDVELGALVASGAVIQQKRKRLLELERILFNSPPKVRSNAEAEERLDDLDELKFLTELFAALDNNWTVGEMRKFGKSFREKLNATGQVL